MEHVLKLLNGACFIPQSITSRFDHYLEVKLFVVRSPFSVVNASLFSPRSYGAVYKAMHKESGQLLAIKKVPVDTDLQEIIKEISIMQQCDSQFVVKYYGSYFKDQDLWVGAPLLPPPPLVHTSVSGTKPDLQWPAVYFDMCAF